MRAWCVVALKSQVALGITPCKFGANSSSAVSTQDAEFRYLQENAMTWPIASVLHRQTCTRRSTCEFLELTLSVLQREFAICRLLELEGGRTQLQYLRFESFFRAGALSQLRVRAHAASASLPKYTTPVDTSHPHHCVSNHITGLGQRLKCHWPSEWQPQTPRWAIVSRLRCPCACLAEAPFPLYPLTALTCRGR